MNARLSNLAILLGICVGYAQLVGVATAQEPTASDTPTLDEVKTEGVLRSSYRNPIPQATTGEAPQANLKAFRAEIAPVLKKACYECHGSETAESDFRIDTLDPNLLHGEDVDWWLEVSAAVTNGEMPPEDGPELTDAGRNRIIEWLSSEIQIASQVRRAEQGHSSFRRMTRYEYNYALQDLLGCKLNFAKDLPPDPVSEDGFRNSSEMLHMSTKQYEEYLVVGRDALDRATVRGERPAMLYWGVSAQRSVERRFAERKKLEELRAEIANANREAAKQRAIRQGNAKEDSSRNELKQLEPADQGADEKVEKQETEKEARDEVVKRQPERRRRTSTDRVKNVPHHVNTETGETFPASWAFRRAVYAWAPTMTRPEVPEHSDYITILPAQQRVVVELGNRLPDRGTLRVRVRASRVAADDSLIPTVALEFGWQGSNQSLASLRISQEDIEIDALPGQPKFYQWDIPLSDIYPRNPVRKTIELDTPKMTNPSEYIRLHNTSASQSADVQFDYVEVSAPVYDQWPPASHKAIFFDSASSKDETAYAREIISRFMGRAWRRSVTDAEVDRKLKLFASIRPTCIDFQQAVAEVLAATLASPQFLYVVQSDRLPEEANRALDEFELATRLSMFLWCSTPDDELIKLAIEGRLGEHEELVRQTKRMLADPRSERFSNHFVRQWLNMNLLDYLSVDKSAYPEFDQTLMEALQQEPIAFFKEVLHNDRSIMDFIHSDYALVNQRLAQHYGISDVNGSQFQKVALKPQDNRGGLMTQAGLLAMNSDGTDSHPLKRGVWLLESLLNDPPPPPPPAVPEIDIADPEILKLTLKQRIENHRDSAACRSCHVKIDPWGIALENFDAIGSWRTQIQGKSVDASSMLFNQHQLDGVDGLKRYLLANRQDQFARAMVYKLTTFALGRPLTFSDRASIDALTAELRNEGDGLATLVTLIVTSDIFQTR